MTVFGALSSDPFCCLRCLRWINSKMHLAHAYCQLRWDIWQHPMKSTDFLYFRKNGGSSQWSSWWFADQFQEPRKSGILHENNVSGESVFQANSWYTRADLYRQPSKWVSPQIQTLFRIHLELISPKTGFFGVVYYCLLLSSCCLPVVFGGGGFFFGVRKKY